MVVLNYSPYFGSQWLFEKNILRQTVFNYFYQFIMRLMAWELDKNMVLKEFLIRHNKYHIPLRLIGGVWDRRQISGFFQLKPNFFLNFAIDTVYKDGRFSQTDSNKSL